MLPDHPQVCLYQPEIPQNTGNIGRLCAATQCRLNLVLPFGFDPSDRNLKRAGLDYWPFLDLEIHKRFSDLAALFQPEEIAFFSARSKRPYTKLNAGHRLLVFGQETRGLPAEIWKQYPDNFFTIPIFHDGVRSLNLANSVSIVLYHVLNITGRLGQ